jgi:hypothetical protein
MKIIAVNPTQSDLWPAMAYILTMAGHYASLEMQASVRSFNAYFPASGYDLVAPVVRASADETYLVAMQVDVANRQLLFAVGGQSNTYTLPSSDAFLPPPNKEMWLVFGRQGVVGEYSDVNNHFCVGRAANKD